MTSGIKQLIVLQIWRCRNVKPNSDSQMQDWWWVDKKSSTAELLHLWWFALTIRKHTDQQAVLPALVILLFENVFVDDSSSGKYI